MNNTCQMERLYLDSRFERFWHWAQAALIIFLALTGLEIHGTYRLFGFDLATELHKDAGIGWFVLYVFIIFWNLTTAEIVRTFAGHTAPISAVTFSPDGKYVVSGSWDHTARIGDYHRKRNCQHVAR